MDFCHAQIPVYFFPQKTLRPFLAELFTLIFLLSEIPLLYISCGGEV